MPSIGALSLVTICAQAAIVVDHEHSSFRDASGRQRLWHGVNLVEKSAPYYPKLDADMIENMRSFGTTVVRLGVMMPGVFPSNMTANSSYLDVIEGIIDTLHAGGIDTIIDLHQDVLAPKVCGEGTPDWMLDTSKLHSLAMPRPLALKKSELDPETGRPKSCAPLGVLKGIGWSEWYMTDMCGKAFQQLYDGEGVMAAAFEAYWKEVAKRFKGHPGVMAYELLNEPWIGDHVANPSLLLKAGAAEAEVGKYMTKMHDVVRAVDPDTLVLYAPAEVNNRAMRRVGYEAGFLPEAAMAYHVYCVVGTDGDGPTTPLLKELCHFNDGFSLKQRDADLQRLKTAGFVTEFGAVAPSDTGLAEVSFILDHFDAMQPPTSWAFWDYNEIVGHANKTQVEAYLRLLARPYPRAIAGQLQKMSLNGDKFSLTFQADANGTSELFVPLRRYSAGYEISMQPETVSLVNASYGLEIHAMQGGQVTLEISAKASSSILV
jgi:endoglycosylceramidase